MLRPCRQPPLPCSLGRHRDRTKRPSKAGSVLAIPRATGGTPFPKRSTLSGSRQSRRARQPHADAGPRRLEARSTRKEGGNAEAPPRGEPLHPVMHGFPLNPGTRKRSACRARHLTTIVMFDEGTFVGSRSAGCFVATALPEVSVTTRPASTTSRDVRSLGIVSAYTNSPGT